MIDLSTGPDLTTEELLSSARQQFEADGVYLNTATVGLPPRSVSEALQESLLAWRTGRADPGVYDRALQTSRRLYAGLVGVDPALVAVGSQVSVFVGLVAVSVRDGGEVLVAEGEFTSVTFPFLAQAGRGVRVREVPLADLPGAIGPGTALVAVSAVQSADGRRVDLDALATAADRAGVPVLLDTTQAVGWLPVDASRFAYTVGGGYKWLLAPRGTGFGTVQRARLDDLVPHNAGWCAGDEPWSSLYGTTMRLAEDARRFDVSPAWHCWVAQAPALQLLTDLGVDVLHDHAVGLAGDFCAAVGLPLGDSAIVTAAVSPERCVELAQSGIAASVRAGRLRLAFHLNNDRTDVDRAAEFLRGHVEP